MPGETVLVIDDSPTILKVVQLVLTKSRYRVETASDGEEGLEKARALQPHLILLDFVMPRMNGYQFCRELRAKEDLKGLPVVLMSAKGDKIRGQFVQQTGAIDAITKPFDARGLVAVVEGALKKHVEGRARPVPDAESMPFEEAETGSMESLRPSRTSFSEDPGLRRVQAAQEYGAALSRLIAPELAKTPDNKAWALDVYARARPGYHPIARASVDEILGYKAR